MRSRPKTLLGLAAALAAVLPQPVAAGDVAVELQLPDDLPSFVRRADGVAFLSPMIEGQGEGEGEGKGGEPREPPAGKVRLGQKGLSFVPHVVTLVVGQTLLLGNDDAEVHSVRCKHPRATFNLTVPPGGERAYRFERQGRYQLLCDIHAHMRAEVLVVPDPWIACFDERGRAVIDEVPPGRYEVRVWHEWLEPVDAEKAPGLGLGWSVGTLEVAADSEVGGKPRLFAVEARLRASVRPPAVHPPAREYEVAPELAARRTVEALRTALAEARKGDGPRAEAELEEALHGHFGGPLGFEVTLRSQLERPRVAEIRESVEQAVSRIRALIAHSGSPATDPTGEDRQAAAARAVQAAATLVEEAAAQLSGD